VRWAVGLLVLVSLGGAARAAEPSPPELFCEGPPATTTKPPATPVVPTSPAWRDLEVALLLSVGLAGAIAYVARNERRRSAGAARPIVWTPYVAGATLGVVFAISLLAFGRPLGVSAGVQQGARLVAGALGPGPGSPAPRSAAALWPLSVLIGVAVGGAASAWLRARSGILAPIFVAGEERTRTWLVAFCAGVLLQIAATIAGGCTSGLALSGGIVLAPAAFVFMAGMFIGGIPTAWVASQLRLRGKEGRP
jgi:uncharacterized protein